MIHFKSNIITVIGNIGSGKSTLTVRLAKEMDAKLIKADNLYLTNPFFPLTVKDRKRWSLTSDLWFLQERVKRIQNECDTEKKYIIIDSGLPMSWVYSHSRIKSDFFRIEEWDLYQTYFNLLTDAILPNHILIELTAPLEILMKRIVKRGREFEKKYFDISYLRSIAYSLGEYKKHVIRMGSRVFSINTEETDLRESTHIQKLISSLQ